jgi:SAM-dependent methyltransferase
MKTIFNTNDAIVSKFEFEKFRSDKPIPFSYKYHTHDAALKYWYVINTIKNNKPNNKKYFNILDLGCGVGDMLRILQGTFMAHGVGFDPMLGDLKVKIRNVISQSSPFKIKKSGRIQLFSMSHLEFQKHNEMKFDFVIDLCSVTHFDTRRYKNVNYGWKWIADYLPKLLEPNGYFITATDVAISSTTGEFIKGDDLIDFFKNRNIGELKYCNEILSTEGNKLLNQVSKKNNASFYRIGNEMNKQDSQISHVLLGVTGLTLRLF